MPAAGRGGGSCEPGGRSVLSDSRGCAASEAGREPAGRETGPGGTGAEGAASGPAGGSGGGGGKAAGSVGLGSSGSGGRGAGPALGVLPVLCGAGWSGGACGI